MSAQIALTCDTEGCGAYCRIHAGDVQTAVRRASEEYGWSHHGGEDFCGPCTRAAS
ncbi:hypothetical protein [Nonomuraea sp. bgisy101]|uniref:hypothetical protein n=1 Tax=Nonomuraea sp. bgisy101 TaxID=3413784 RepID=UPI003D738E5A